MDFLIAFAVTLLALGAYWLSCKIWPFGPCFRCIGHAGRNHGSNSRRWGTCKRCKGSGRRIRVGARIWHLVKEGH